MQYNIALLALVGVTFAVPQSSGDTSGSGSPEEVYLHEVCAPTNGTGYPDLDAPCNAIYAIEVECVYGPDYLTTLLSSVESQGPVRRRNLLRRQSDDSSDDGPPTLSNATQRACFCQSQFWDQANGCAACYKAHGDSQDLLQINSDSLATLSSSYCAASATPTAGFADVAFALVSNYSTPSTTAPFSKFSDPIGNKTQVSLYYTARVTGSAAYNVAVPGTGTAASYTALNTVDGQIKPTASQNNAAAPPTTTGAAVRTEAAIAGVVGIAGLLALI